jgi:hypothetical protein
MLETLAGRLKWERVGDGIRVVIPARFPWMATRHMLILNSFGIFVPIAMMSAYSYLNGEPESWRGILIGSAFGLITGYLGFMLTARTILSLDQSSITFQYRSFGIKRGTKKYLNEQLNNLQFISSSNREEIRNEYRQNEMQIDQDLRTHSFAEGITKQEADALIEKMMEIYTFPKSRVQ